MKIETHVISSDFFPEKKNRGAYEIMWKNTVETDRINAINLLTPNVNYSGRTAPLTSKVAFYIFIQQI